MSAARARCATCQMPLGGLHEETGCLNPRCAESVAVDGAALARIVIELRPEERLVATWWRSDGLSVYAGALVFMQMLEVAAPLLAASVREMLDQARLRN